jgi:hypothetical protein
MRERDVKRPVEAQEPIDERNVDDQAVVLEPYFGHESPSERWTVPRISAFGRRNASTKAE